MKPELVPGPPRVVRVEPEDGAQGVLSDALVLVRVSVPLDPSSVSAATLCLLGPRGVVPCRLGLSPDRRVLINQPLEPLAAGASHVVAAAGLRDEQGRAVVPHQSRFVAGSLGRAELTLPR